MSKHEKKTSSLLHYPVLVVFSLFFIGLFALDMLTPDHRYLANGLDGGCPSGRIAIRAVADRYRPTTIGCASSFL